MKTKLSKLFLALFLGVNLLLVPTGFSQAACTAADQPDDLRIVANLFNVKFCNANDFVVAVINTILLIIAVVAVLFIVIGGFKYLTSQGNSEVVESARQTIVNALIGLLIAVLAYAIVATVINTVKKSNNTDVPNVGSDGSGGSGGTGGTGGTGGSGGSGGSGGAGSTSAQQTAINNIRGRMVISAPRPSGPINVFVNATSSELRLFCPEFPNPSSVIVVSRADIDVKDNSGTRLFSATKDQPTPGGRGAVIVDLASGKTIPDGGRVEAQVAISVSGCIIPIPRVSKSSLEVLGRTYADDSTIDAGDRNNILSNISIDRTYDSAGTATIAVTSSIDKEVVDRVCRDALTDTKYLQVLLNTKTGVASDRYSSPTRGFRLEGSKYTNDLAFTYSGTIKHQDALVKVCGVEIGYVQMTVRDENDFYYGTQ